MAVKKGRTSAKKRAGKRGSKKAAKKAVAKKSLAKKSLAKKSAAKKPTAKKAAVKKTAKRAAAKKASGKTSRSPKQVARKTGRTLATKSAATKKAASKSRTGRGLAPNQSPVRPATTPIANSVGRAAPPTATHKSADKASRRTLRGRKGPTAAPPARKVSLRTAVGNAVPGTTRRRRAAAAPRRAAEGIEVRGQAVERMNEILTEDALQFLALLHRRFDGERLRLLAARAERQKRFDEGELPDFLEATQSIRDDQWSVAPIPADLQDRRVEITGPVDRKMIVNALNSGAKVFMADFEDATSPTWSNIVEGQVNLKDRWAGTIGFADPSTGRFYDIGTRPAVLMVRPRGWHLPEAHVLVDGEEMSGALFDFALYVFHNAEAQLAQGATPAFYLPKLESHLEARLWNDVFLAAEDHLGLAKGTFKATVLIETLPAAFEMEEILYELRDHIAGLNCGRWDYIFSFIKRLGKNPRFLTPDRGAMVMGRAFLNAYSLLLIKTCHRRGAFAMGGMAAQIPVRSNPEINQIAFEKVRADKEREAGNGHDGTWVAHPDLVPIAMEVFDRLMPGSNQLARLRQDIVIERDALLEMHEGLRTENGLRENIRVGVQYIEAWLRGRGAVPLYNLMEDAATAEISRAQIWQWLYHSAELDDGRRVTKELFEDIMNDEMAKVREALGADVYDHGRFADATRLFADMSLAREFEEFLTLPAYRQLD
jgi:malate synthase